MLEAAGKVETWGNSLFDTRLKCATLFVPGYFFLPHWTLGLNFVPNMTLPYLLAVLNDSWKDNFATGAVCDKTLDQNNTYMRISPCIHHFFFAQRSLHILEQSTHGSPEVSIADYNLVHKTRKQEKRKCKTASVGHVANKTQKKHTLCLGCSHR
jgi:hypothetical protein